MLACEGRIDEAIPYFQRAIDLVLTILLALGILFYRAIAHLFAREFDLAEEWGRARPMRVPNCHYWGFCAPGIASLALATGG